jgi:hypothetical protein
MENLNNRWNTNCNIFSGWRASYFGPFTFDGWNYEPSSFAIFLLASDSKRTTKVTTKIPSYDISIVNPIRCSNFSNLFSFWDDTLHVSVGLSVYLQEFKTVHTPVTVSTCFGQSFRLSSGVQDCKYSNRYTSNRNCCLLASKQTPGMYTLELLTIDGKTDRNI